MKATKVDITDDLADIVFDFYEEYRNPNYKAEHEVEFDNVIHFVQVDFYMVVETRQEPSGDPDIPGETVLTNFHLTINEAKVFDGKGDPIECEYNEEQVIEYVKDNFKQ